MHLLGIQGRLGVEVSSKTAKEIWVKGFLRLIGFTTSIISELWALKDGLSLAIQLGFYQLEVELNAMVIVDLINSDKNPNRDYSPLLYDCRSLLARLPQVRCLACLWKRTNVLTFWLKGDAPCGKTLLFFISPPSIEFASLLA